MTAPPLPIIYFLAILALFAAALVIHLRATALSLPLEMLSIPTIVLALFAGVNSYLHSQLTSFFSAANHVRDPTTRRRRRRNLKIARTSTQTIQGLFAAVLAAFLLQRIVPNELLSCSLEGAWSHMWKQHDASGIRVIEEAFKCCGFRTVKDRPWPFPTGPNLNPNICRERMGYTVACEGPWTAQMRSSAGGDFAIVVIVSLMQIGNILVHARYFGRLRPWFSEAGPLLLPAEDQEDGQHRRRPLLPSSLSSRSQTRSNVGRIIEEEDEGEEGRGSGGGIENGDDGAANKAIGGGRVYPSNIGGAGAVQSLQQQHEGNVWSQSHQDSDSSSASELY